MSLVSLVLVSFRYTPFSFGNNRLKGACDIVHIVNNEHLIRLYLCFSARARALVVANGMQLLNRLLYFLF